MTASGSYAAAHRSPVAVPELLNNGRSFFFFFFFAEHFDATVRCTSDLLDIKCRNFIMLSYLAVVGQNVLEISNKKTKKVLYEVTMASTSDRWPFKCWTVRLWVLVDIRTKFEDIPSVCLWDITLTRPRDGLTTQRHDASGPQLSNIITSTHVSTNINFKWIKWPLK